MRITDKDTAVLVVDYQEKLIPAMNEKEELIKTSRTFLSGIKELNIPMVVTQQYTKGLGATIPEIAECIGDFNAHDKVTFSGCGTEEIFSAIKDLNKKNILVCGTEAHVCVLQSAIDLKAAGYNVFLVEDCIGSRTLSNKENAIKRAMGEGILITCCESALFELTAAAGTPHFKVISKIVK